MEGDAAKFPRTAKLAIPLDRKKSKKFVKPRRWKFSSGVAQGAKTYVITKRVLDLTTIPSHKLINEPEVELGIVEQKALNSKASKRIKQLAVPKKRVGDIHSKPHPFRISKRALKHRATKRTKILARPKSMARPNN